MAADEKSVCLIQFVSSLGIHHSSLTEESDMGDMEFLLLGHCRRFGVTESLGDKEV